jgi:hypothetical protein
MIRIQLRCPSTSVLAIETRKLTENCHLLLYSLTAALILTGDSAAATVVQHESSFDRDDSGITTTLT